MRTKAPARGVFAVAIALSVAGCAVTVPGPAGYPYGPPTYVVRDEPVYEWRWAPWPHYERRYYTRDDDHGRHRGWYKHDDD